MIWNPLEQKFCQREKSSQFSSLKMNECELLNYYSFKLHLHLPWLGVRLIWKSRFPPSAIMSLTSRAEEETPNLRDQRTIFVGNLPIEIASKRVSQYHFPLSFTQTLYKLAFVETTTTAYSNFCAHCKNWISTVPFHTIPNTYVQTTDFWRWRRQYH